MHVGTRSFVVNVLNSLSKGALKIMLTRLAEMENDYSVAARKDLQKHFPWTNPRLTAQLPRPVRKRCRRSMLLKPKPARPQEQDNARGLCSEILRKFASTPQTRVACQMTVCRVYDGVVELEFDLNCMYKFTAINSTASVYEARLIRNTDLLQSLYSDQTCTYTMVRINAKVPI